MRPAQVGQSVSLNGWAQKVRNLGGVCFVDLRDRTGISQLVLDPIAFPITESLRPESCLSVSGAVRSRSPETVNSRLDTGEIEVVVGDLKVLSPSKPLPFQVSDEEHMQSVNEELRVKHRYLDLRRPAMYRKLAIRASIVRRIRAYLDARDFLEVETPIFTRSTPEGARDYLVPYRLEPGRFYALPQSPQQYKQLLMVGGLERYYQIAKCFRDEAQRSDRQPEFTQLDLEMSFVREEDVLELIEGLTIEVVNGVIAEFGLAKGPIGAFKRISYDDAMRRYGTDKPDMRFGLELFDATDWARTSGFGVFRSAAEAEGGSVRGVRYPGGSELSRKEIGVLEAAAQSWGAKGLASLSVSTEPSESSRPAEGGRLHFGGSIAKFFEPGQLAELAALSGAEHGDLLLFVAGPYEPAGAVLSRLRSEIAARTGLAKSEDLDFLFVTDFPLVLWNEDERRWDSAHHPFSSPRLEDVELLESNPGAVRALCYDIVCNGFEWASGSIRIHDPQLQARVFALLGIDEARQHSRFGHILEAFSYGAPPHGGIASGIDRLVMFLTDDDNIREVMAFPKMGQGYDPLMDAPGEIDEQQWKELGLRLS